MKKKLPGRGWKNKIFVGKKNNKLQCLEKGGTVRLLNPEHKKTKLSKVQAGHLDSTGCRVAGAQRSAALDAEAGRDSPGRSPQGRALGEAGSG